MSFYAVRQGEKGQIVFMWKECQRLIADWNALRKTDRSLRPVEYKKFNTEAEANEFLKVGYKPNYDKQAKRNDLHKHAERIAEFNVALDEAKAKNHCIFYVDGACSPARAQLGVFSVAQEEGFTRNFRLPPITNNRCEISASIAAMQHFLASKSALAAYAGITIFTDSSYSKIAQDCAYKYWYDSGVWVKSDGKPVENVDLLVCSVRLRKEIIRGGQAVDIQLVPGHCNTLADRLSKMEGVFEDFKLSHTLF